MPHRAISPAVLPPPVPLSPARPGQRWVMHARAVLPAFALMAGGVAASVALLPLVGSGAWAVAVLAVALGLIGLLVSPTRRWRALGWAAGEGELHSAGGVWTRWHTVVPFARVQHIDVAQGPLERAFGVARLVVHTAGTAHAVVVLPGLSPDEAEALRDRLRAAIADE